MEPVVHVWNVIAACGWYAVLSRRLRHIVDKQDSGVIFLFVVAGALSIGSVMAAGNVIRTFAPSVMIQTTPTELLEYHVLVVGIIEELAKFAFFAAVLVPLSLPKEPQDGVILGAVTGLAFGALENVSYIQVFGVTPIIAMRPVIATGGHMIFGAIWGGIFSKALYTSEHTRDPHVWQQAAGGVLFVALLHGMYNFLSSFQFGLFTGTLVDVIGLIIALQLYIHLIERSPYNTLPLHRAGDAVPRLHRGLDFNPSSTILNRNLGFYLLYLGRYRESAMHLRRAVPRARDPRRLRFFAAIAELEVVPIARALRTLRSAWSRLSDEQRVSYMRQAGRILAKQPDLMEKLETAIESRFRRVEEGAPRGQPSPGVTPRGA